MHTEGPLHVPVPQDAPPGNYFINVGLFKVRDDLNTSVRYVNTYRWSDGVYTEEQPTLPADYIKQPYLNRNSTQQWRVGRIAIVPRTAARSAPAMAAESREMEDLVKSTASEILSKPAPKGDKTRNGARPVRSRRGAAGEGPNGD